MAWPIPDTGQTKCYDSAGEISCPAPGEAFYGQDGNYTKLDANSAALSDDAATWAMVKDNVTGLIGKKRPATDLFMTTSRPLPVL